MKSKKLIIIFFGTILLITGCLGVPGNKAVIEKSLLPLDRTTYIGYSDATDHGYAMAVVTIDDDRITNVTLKEFTELSVEKDFSTYEYTPSVQTHTSLPQRFIEVQGTEVDSIAGATVSSSRYKQALERALKSAKTQEKQKKYFDGIFQGRSKADNHGYGIALVEIKDDTIIKVVLKEVNENGELKDFSTYPHVPSRQAYRELPQRFVQSNSPSIDNFTGATHSTDKYKEAVENALVKATIEKDLPDLIDGTYIAVSDVSSQGYSSATVTIENNMIAQVNLKEYDQASVEKDFALYEYEPSANANKELPWAFIAAQSSHVDIVTGATYSSQQYIQAVERAMEKAALVKKGGKYFDGVFQAKSKTDEHGYAIAMVTIKGDKITNVELKYIDAEGRKRDFETYDYAPSVKAYRELPKKFVMGNTYDVDTVTGATISSIKYIQAVKNALEIAEL
ncbi:MAG: FMN-binding protein [Thermoanaerobacteraceae bacterium]|nr:FMN-binding protein [Thermoanaerobacteraceae bacterium]